MYIGWKRCALVDRAAGELSCKDLLDFSGVIYRPGWRVHYGKKLRGISLTRCRDVRIPLSHGGGIAAVSKFNENKLIFFTCLKSGISELPVGEQGFAPPLQSVAMGNT
jgi:hypothetical protein